MPIRGGTVPSIGTAPSESGVPVHDDFLHFENDRNLVGDHRSFS
jgi:hypothetical protein